jgi:hypothetical protein
MGDGAASDFFTTLGRLTGEAIKEKVRLQLDFEDARKVIGCIVEQLMAGNYFSSHDELCEHIAKLSGIPRDKVETTLLESKKIWREREARVLKP